MNDWAKGYSTINTRGDHNWTHGYLTIGSMNKHWSGEYSAIGKSTNKRPSKVKKARKRKNLIDFSLYIAGFEKIDEH